MCENFNLRTVQELQFNVAQLLKETTGASRTYDIVVVAAGKLDEEVSVVAPITGHVKLLRTGKDILATGMLHTTLKKSCGRCLAEFTTPITIELEEEFYPTLDLVTGSILPEPEDADEANRIDERHLLNLWEVVRQEILLEGNSILYCRPDCKGLCPQCGQDWNVADCDCEQEEIDVRWAGLRELHAED